MSDIKKLANEYAHCYSFVDDDTMLIKRAELYNAIDQLNAKVTKLESALSKIRDLRPNEFDNHIIVGEMADIANEALQYIHKPIDLKG